MKTQKFKELYIHKLLNHEFAGITIMGDGKLELEGYLVINIYTLEHTVFNLIYLYVMYIFFFV